MTEFTMPIMLSFLLSLFYVGIKPLRKMVGILTILGTTFIITIVFQDNITESLSQSNIVIATVCGMFIVFVLSVRSHNKDSYTLLLTVPFLVATVFRTIQQNMIIDTMIFLELSYLVSYITILNASEKEKTNIITHSFLPIIYTLILSVLSILLIMSGVGKSEQGVTLIPSNNLVLSGVGIWFLTLVTKIIYINNKFVNNVEEKGQNYTEEMFYYAFFIVPSLFCVTLIKIEDISLSPLFEKLDYILLGISIFLTLKVLTEKRWSSAVRSCFWISIMMIVVGSHHSNNHVEQINITMLYMGMTLFSLIGLLLLPTSFLRDVKIIKYFLMLTLFGLPPGVSMLYRVKMITSNISTGELAYFLLSLILGVTGFFVLSRFDFVNRRGEQNNKLSGSSFRRKLYEISPLIIIIVLIIISES